MVTVNGNAVREAMSLHQDDTTVLIGKTGIQMLTKSQRGAVVMKKPSPKTDMIIIVIVLSATVDMTRTG